MRVDTYAKYLGEHKGSTGAPDLPRSPDLVKEVAHYVGMPMYCHDVPVSEFCPAMQSVWTPSSLFGINASEFQLSGTAFWGPAGSQAYPLHTNDAGASGPLLKVVTQGRQEVAIFPRGE